MTPISDRPRTWNQVVGQDRAVRLLHALIRHPQYMTRGFIFEGPFAVGKTSCAYLFARALMCLGDDPLHCRQCASCLTALESIDHHPSFREVDGAMYPSANEARELLDQIQGLAALGKRQVVLVDEAHRLSERAFDTFLKPLERGDTEVVFIFATSEGHNVPGSIRSRCAVLRFEPVALDLLVGMLMRKADEEKIRYTKAGLEKVARFAEGRPRDARNGLALAAALGAVTPENVDIALNQDNETIALEVLTRIVENKLQEAIKKGVDLSCRIGPAKFIETVFAAYARDVYTAKTVSPQFASIREMSAVLIKWSASSNLPVDAVPIFLAELDELCRVRRAPAPPPTPTALETAPRILTQEEIRAALENA